MNEINFSSTNWLALKINNQSFERFRHKIKGRVIHLGYGTSPYKEDMVKVAEEYIGVDWEHSFHNRPNVDVFADLSKPFPCEGECADNISSFQVMEPLKEPRLFLSECYRILKTGRWLFITLPFMWQVHQAPYNFFPYTRFGLRYLLEKNGFVDIEIQENSGFWQMWVLKFNYHTERFAQGPFKYSRIPIW